MKFHKIIYRENSDIDLEKNIWGFCWKLKKNIIIYKQKKNEKLLNYLQKQQE